jgi:hypothetical protein
MNAVILIALGLATLVPATGSAMANREDVVARRSEAATAVRARMPQAPRRTLLAWGAGSVLQGEYSSRVHTRLTQLTCHPLAPQLIAPAILLIPSTSLSSATHALMVRTQNGAQANRAMSISADSATTLISVTPR